MQIPSQDELPKKVDVCRGADLWTISTPTLTAYQTVVERHKDTASYITIWKQCGCAKRYYQSGMIKTISTCQDGWSDHD
jgi:hypothetical protein